MSGKRSSIQLKEEEKKLKRTIILLPEILGVEEMFITMFIFRAYRSDQCLHVPVLEDSKKGFIT